MNIVFFILVALGAILLWVVLSALFNGIGNVLVSIFINTRDNMQKTKEEAPKEKRR